MLFALDFKSLKAWSLEKKLVTLCKSLLFESWPLEYCTPVSFDLSNSTRHKELAKIDKKLKKKTVEEAPSEEESMAEMEFETNTECPKCGLFLSGLTSGNSYIYAGFFAIVMFIVFAIALDRTQLSSGRIAISCLIISSITYKLTFIIKICLLFL